MPRRFVIGIMLSFRHVESDMMRRMIIQLRMIKCELCRCSSIKLIWDAVTKLDGSSSYTASLTSSVLNYPTEYGRRYHAFRAGGRSLMNIAGDDHVTKMKSAYNFPNDEVLFGSVW